MTLREEMKLAMTQALTDSQNYNIDGTVNWNFIDADVYIDVYGEVDQQSRDDNLFYQYFDELAFELGD